MELHTALQHTTELYTAQRLGGVLARLCAIYPDSHVDCPKVGPTSVLSSRHWANFSPTYIAVWLVRLWRGLPIRATHKTEPTHYRAAGLCAARWCAARLCAIRLGSVEAHPCFFILEIFIKNIVIIWIIYSAAVLCMDVDIASSIGWHQKTLITSLLQCFDICWKQQTNYSYIYKYNECGYVQTPNLTVGISIVKHF